MILLGGWVFGNTNFSEKGLFVYLSSILENAIQQKHPPHWRNPVTNTDGYIMPVITMSPRVSVFQNGTLFFNLDDKPM